MTVDGGSLVYGLGEDKDGRLTVLAPVELAGAQRVAQIVETSISEPPFVRIQTLPLEEDPSKGYVLVIVEGLLRDELGRAPEANPELGYLLAFARPVVPDDSMVERVAADGNELLQLLMEGARSWGDIRADRFGRATTLTFAARSIHGGVALRVGR